MRVSVTRHMNELSGRSARQVSAGGARAITARVLLVETQHLFRDALARVINEAGGFQVSADADTGSEAVKICRRFAPDVVVIGIALEDADAIEVTGEILKLRPRTKVILMQSSRDEDVTLRAIRSGALGVVSTRAPASRLIEALRTVTQGRSYVGSAAWDVVLNRLAKTRQKDHPTGLESLSPRQRQILALIARGRTTNEIAAILGAGVGAVRSQRQEIMRKIGVKNTAELIKVALANGFQAGSL
jgi:DNA-binding NarL/FixJ family response regulator